MYGNFNITHDLKDVCTLIDTSCEAINDQLTIARFGDSLDKKGIGITPDPFGEDAYNLQSIGAPPEKRVWGMRLGVIHG